MTTPPPVSDIVKLPVVAMQSDAREFAEVQQVAAVLVFQHADNTTT